MTVSREGNSSTSTTSMLCVRRKLRKRELLRRNDADTGGGTAVRVAAGVATGAAAEGVDKGTDADTGGSTAVGVAAGAATGAAAGAAAEEADKGTADTCGRGVMPRRRNESLSLPLSAALRWRLRAVALGEGSSTKPPSWSTAEL